MAATDYDLGTAELDVLRVLWDEGPAPVRDVMNHLHSRGRDWAYTTVQTLLTRLEQKGAVTSDKSGLAFVFRPVVSRDRVRRSRLKELVEELYDGAAGSLVLHLVKTQRLSGDEVAELSKLIEQLDSKGKRSKA
jgi:predicted transcriptional regulator